MQRYLFFLLTAFLNWTKILAMPFHHTKLLATSRKIIDAPTHKQNSLQVALNLTPKDETYILLKVCTIEGIKHTYY